MSYTVQLDGVRPIIFDRSVDAHKIVNTVINWPNAVLDP